MTSSSLFAGGNDAKSRWRKTLPRKHPNGTQSPKPKAQLQAYRVRSNFGTEVGNFPKIAGIINQRSCGRLGRYEMNPGPSIVTGIKTERMGRSERPMCNRLQHASWHGMYKKQETTPSVPRGHTAPSPSQDQSTISSRDPSAQQFFVS